ncbi:MAG: hypothetical protein HQ475_11685 [SAR202 cluster bacterium]|nr:hypothetical protein [SAR202 cluster bacterium]
MVKPAYEIKMVKENLDLSLALLQAAQEEKVTAKQLFRDGPEEMFIAFAVDSGPGQNELTRRVANQVRAAFALSVIQTQRSLDRIFTNAPIDEENPDLQAARCVMYLLYNTVYPNLFSPVWNCPPQYRRKFEVRPVSILMDAGELHGKGLSWDHVGGLKQYLDLLAYFAYWVEDLPEINGPILTVPAATSRVVIPEESEVEETLATPPAADKIDGPVAQFITDKCDLNSQNRTLAKDLYAGFQEWCRETGLEDVSQRSFGMQLTAVGLQRKRRGRGKHWWEGIRLSGSPEQMAETATSASRELQNGHYEGYQTELLT